MVFFERWEIWNGGGDRWYSVESCGLFAVAVVVRGVFERWEIWNGGGDRWYSVEICGLFVVAAVVRVLRGGKFGMVVVTGGIR